MSCSVSVAVLANYQSYNDTAELFIVPVAILVYSKSLNPTRDRSCNMHHLHTKLLHMQSAQQLFHF